MGTLTYRCEDCGRRYDLLRHHDGSLSALDHDRDIEDLSCPDCRSGQRKRLLTAPVPVRTGGTHGVGRFYPRYDSNLGCMLYSDAHRDRICAERNLIPVDAMGGSWDPVADGEQYDHDHREAIERKNEIEREYDEHPDFREYRELRDKGYYTDQVLPEGAKII